MGSMKKTVDIEGQEVTLEKQRNGSLKIFINYEDTDTLVVFTSQPKPFGGRDSLHYAGITLGGNLDVKTRPRQHANLKVPALPVSRDELSRRRVAWGLSPLKPVTELVAVVFAEFDSPAEADAAKNWRRYTYEVPVDWKVTVGDRLRVPTGTIYADYREKVATVVELNAKCPAPYVKLALEKL